jgi:hypothetical protein
MRKSKIIVTTVDKEVITSVTCDFCGKEFDKKDAEQGIFNTINIDVAWDSKYDGYKFSGEICDDCIAKIIDGKLKKVQVFEIG